MSAENDLTSGSLLRVMLRFSVPYLIACFLQSFYGMADLFIAGQFNGAAIVTAISVGSQVMHMITVMVVGLVMGSTVAISRSIGAGRRDHAAKFIGNSVTIFAILAITAMIITVLSARGILTLLSTPAEAKEEAAAYLTICFAGIPFITAYNVISGIFRGLGDTRRPMIFVAIAGVINIGLDYGFIGMLGMGAAGAALATILSQAVSVLFALLSLRRMDIGVKLSRSDFYPDGQAVRNLLSIGVPVACQEGMIQISFLIITMIANSRGVDVAAAVGIVEKFISFVFLVPSAMLSTVSAVSAQNAGAGKHDRSRKALSYGIYTCLGFGLVVFIVCQFLSPQIVSLFVKNEPEVVRLGGEYLRTYSADCAIAGVHFCFSGYFSAYEKSIYSFVHNIISAFVIRIPGAYLASVLFPDRLLQMGIAAPAGSLLSILICLVFYRKMKNQKPKLIQ